MPGMPGMPPPKKSGGALIAALIGGGLIVVVLIAVVVFVVVSGGGKSDEDKLNAAADALAPARAVGLKGDFGGGADTLRGELSVTKGGRATGQVTWNTDDVTMLSADGKLFVKADSAYWKRQISGSETPYFLGGGQQWGRLSADKLDLDFKQELTPSALATKVRQAATAKAKSTKATVQGKKALRFSTASGTIVISDSDDAELLRFEGFSPKVAVDVQGKSSGEASTVVSEMRTRIGELKDAFNGSARPTVAEWKKGGCNSDSGCTVEAKIRPPFGAETPLTVEVQFRLTAGTLSGRELGKCTSTITISSSTPVWASCRVNSSAWSSWAKATGGTYYKHADYKVIGATSEDVQGMLSGLDGEGG